MRLLAGYSSALDLTNKGKSAWLIAGSIVGLMRATRCTPIPLLPPQTAEGRHPAVA